MGLLNKDPENMTCEERMDALADVLAEGLFYIAQHGLSESVDKTLTSDGEEGTPSLREGGGKHEK